MLIFLAFYGYNYVLTTATERAFIMNNNFKQPQDLQGWNEISLTDLCKKLDSWVDWVDANPNTGKKLSKRIQQCMQDTLINEGTVLDKIYYYDNVFLGKPEPMPTDLAMVIDLACNHGDNGHWFTKVDEHISVFNDYPETLDYLYVKFEIGNSYDNVLLGKSEIVPFYIKAKAS